MIDVGWGNGYVCIPNGHPMYGVPYDDIPVDVHGGLTFSNYSNEIDWPEVPKGDFWVVGFDCAHLGDNKSNWPESRVLSETQQLEQQLTNLKVVDREDPDEDEESSELGDVAVGIGLGILVDSIFSDSDSSDSPDTSSDSSSDVDFGGGDFGGGGGGGDW